MPYTPNSDPTSVELALTANTVNSWQPTVAPTELVFVNDGTADVWITVNGPAPTSGGANEWFLAGGVGQTITVTVQPEPQTEDLPGENLPIVQALCASSQSIYIRAN